MASPSSSSYQYRYHAFLSFRGADTRKAFADHLYTALICSGIHTFRDDDEIKRGTYIGQELNKAINESRVSIVLFSKSYATSRWCLNELERIMEQHRASGHRVLPVFYDVDPKDVRNQTGSFAEAFAKYVREQEKDKVQEWQRALGDVANMGGMVLGDQYESQFIQKIVHEIEKMLNDSAIIASNLVGMPYRMRDLDLWLKDGSNDVDVALLCGTHGIGKTTIAQVAYDLNSYRFEGSSFLGVGGDSLKTLEGSLEPNDILLLQQKLVSDIQRRRVETERSEPMDFSSTSEGKSKVKHAVCCKKVLIVFDDVVDWKQVCAILGNWQWCCPGSKIVITTRNEHLLRDLEIPHAVFKVEPLDEHESLELFDRYALIPLKKAHLFGRQEFFMCALIEICLVSLQKSLSHEEPFLSQNKQIKKSLELFNRYDVIETVLKNMEGLLICAFPLFAACRYSLRDLFDESVQQFIICVKKLFYVARKHDIATWCMWWKEQELVSRDMIGTVCVFLEKSQGVLRCVFSLISGCLDFLEKSPSCEIRHLFNGYASIKDRSRLECQEDSRRLVCQLSKGIPLALINMGEIFFSQEIRFDSSKWKSAVDLIRTVIRESMVSTINGEEEEELLLTLVRVCGYSKFDVVRLRSFMKEMSVVFKHIVPDPV